MLISDVAIRRPVFTAMIMSSLVVFGYVFYRDLGVDLFPRVEFPVVTILTTLPGADPETIETMVTDPIEESVNTIEGIKYLRSTSADSVSQVVIEFELEKDADVAFQEVQSKISAVRMELPDDVEEPVIEKFDIDSAPLLYVIVSAEMSVRELTRLADKEVKERLQRVPDVGSVKLVGGRDRKIWIWLDPVRLKKHHLTTHDVIQALQQEHVELPGGRVETGPLELVAKIKAEFQSAEDFNRMVIARRGDSVLRLQDVGRAEDGLEERRSHAQLDDNPCIALLIRRQSGTNSVAVADNVKKQVEKLRKEMKARTVRLEIAQDQSIFIKHSVDEVKFHLVFGGGLAIFIVFIFLLNTRSTFISSLVLPTSVISTFIMMGYMGFTLNMMTLLGLTLAIGLLIDDAIVVQENIMRHVEAGKPAPEAASFATNEIGLAVLATTLSVVAVFLPVAMMKGIVGRFFFPFALTVSVAVMISMFVSFTLDPSLSSRILSKPGKLNPVYAFLDACFRLMERTYKAILGFALRFRFLVLVLAISTFAGSMFFAGGLRSEFVPVEDQSEFNIMVRAPLGSSVDRTCGILEEIRSKIQDIPELEYSFFTVGADELGRVNEGVYYAKLSEKDQRERGQLEIMDVARERLKDVKDAVISVQVVPRVSGGGWKFADVQYEIRGPDFTVLNDLTAQLIDRMKKSTGYVDIDTTFQTGKPEADVYINRARAADLGVSPLIVGQTVRAAIGGVDVAKFKAEGDRYDIAVRFLPSFREKPERIEELWVPSSKGEMIELRNVAGVVTTGTPVEINRFNRQRQVTLLSNLSGKVLGEAVTEIDGFMEQIGVPSGYEVGWTGFADTMAESFAHLFFTMFLSVIVMYMVLASQFESFIHPFTIMLSLPLAIVGALGALLATGLTVNIFTMMAFIFLLGLVTKNAILLIDYTNTLRQRDGMEREAALLKAGPVRLRPILMTSLAMIFGMLPVAVGTGAGSESRQPMAVAIIGGLFSSTLLTLVVVPAVYSLVDQFGGWIRRLVRLEKRKHTLGPPSEQRPTETSPVVVTESQRVSS